MSCMVQSGDEYGARFFMGVAVHLPHLWRFQRLVRRRFPIALLVQSLDGLLSPSLSAQLIAPYKREKSNLVCFFRARQGFNHSDLIWKAYNFALRRRNLSLTTLPTSDSRLRSPLQRGCSRKPSTFRYIRLLSQSNSCFFALST